MEVKAIDNLSLMNFEGKSRNSQRKNIRHSHPQMDAPASEKSARYTIMNCTDLKERNLYEKWTDIFEKLSFTCKQRKAN